MSNYIIFFEKLKMEANANFVDLRDLSTIANLFLFMIFKKSDISTTYIEIFLISLFTNGFCMHIVYS